MMSIIGFLDANVVWTSLLILHGLIAVALLGALTHQALALGRNNSISNENFLNRFQGVDASIYALPICVIWIADFLLGGIIYANYRINVRIPLEQMGLMRTQGFFELKEHLSSFGLLLLPAYFSLWQIQKAHFFLARKWLTYLLCSICWFSFLVGHFVNNTRGLGQ